MSLTYISEKIKGKKLVFLIVLIVFFAADMYFLYEKVNNSEGVTYLDGYDSGIVNMKYPVYASKNGSSYYYSWCGGLNRIKESNRVTFFDKNDAIMRGYKKAKNCPGK